MVIRVVGKPTDETGVLDVLLGVFAIVGGLMLLALLAGLLVAGLLIALRRFFPKNPFNGTGSDRVRLGLDASTQ
jgi:hypothetical protein